MHCISTQPVSRPPSLVCVCVCVGECVVRAEERLAWEWSRGEGMIQHTVFRIASLMRALTRAR